MALSLARKLQFDHLLRSYPLNIFFSSSLVAVLSSFAALLLTFPSLPPLIPLLPNEGFLTEKSLLFLVPTCALAFLVIDAYATDYFLRRNEPATAIFSTFLGTVTSALLATSLFRIVRLYPTAPFPFETRLYPLLLPFAAAATLSILLATITERVARRLKLLDKPHGPYPKVRATPRLGAIPLYIAFATTAITLLTPDKNLIALLIGGGVITIVQSVDDIHPLPFWVQGGGHLLAALAVIAGGIGIEYVRNPLYPWIGEQLLFLNQWEVPFAWGGATNHFTVPADIFTLIWIFALVNVIDWLDGLDGLATGISTIAGVAITAISFVAGTPTTALLGSILVGVSFGFLPSNFFPARIYLGGGAFLLGYLLAVLSIFSGAKTGTALLVLALPIIDAFYVIYRRVREKRSPFVGDTTHLHHRLLEKGLSQPQIVFVEWGIVTLLAIAAVVLTGVYKLLGLIVVFIGALLANRWLLRRSGKTTPNRGQS